jgi:hypothetical protein
MNKELIKKAIYVNFACDRQMKCDTKLEESVDAALGFFLHLCGEESNVFNQLIKRDRYKNKLILINRYLNQNEK